MAAAADPGVRLAHYREHAGCDVLLTCRGCIHREVLALEAVIARLKARGLGDENTGILAVATFVKRECPRCGAVAWQTGPSWGWKPDQMGQPRGGSPTSIS